MPTPLFRLDLTRHLDPVLQLARARPDRVRLVAWAVRYLVENTDGLDVIIVERPGTLRPVEVLGAAWLDAVRRALGRESLDDVEAVVGRVTEAVELECLSPACAPNVIPVGTTGGGRGTGRQAVSHGDRAGVSLGRAGGRARRVSSALRRSHPVPERPLPPAPAAPAG